MGKCFLVGVEVLLLQGREHSLVTRHGNWPYDLIGFWNCECNVDLDTDPTANAHSMASEHPQLGLRKRGKQRPVCKSDSNRRDAWLKACPSTSEGCGRSTSLGSMNEL